MEGSSHLAGIQFPPGFRFHPTDQELIIHYLGKKVADSIPPASSIFAEIDLYKHNPWELPEMALFGEGEWFFFTPRKRKYPNGVRPNRVTKSGYWKAIGIDKPILVSGGTHCLGVKKALVFYKGLPQKGMKTDWIMHEYRILDSVVSYRSQKQKGSMRSDDWVLCRIRKKGGLMPPENGENSEMLSPTPAIFCKAQQHNEKPQQLQHQQAEMEGGKLSAINVRPKAIYLQPGNSAEADSTVEKSDNFGGSDGGESGSFRAQKLHGDPRDQYLFSSMLGPIKTKLPFVDFDELMLLQPSKKFQLWPEESDSDDPSFLEFSV